MASKAIQAARLLSRRSHVLPDQLLVSELFFEVPQDYKNLSRGTLQLFGRTVTKHERPIVPLSEADAKKADQKPWLIYLEGGPGFGNREPQDSPITRMALSRGYQVLFLDYRGTGLSTPVSAAMLATKGAPTDQAAYLRLLRADNIVRDCEAVRHLLTEDYPEEKKRWSLLGQSFGGFVSLSYLSLYPQGLREVFMTGGLAPVGKTAEQVYSALFRRVIQRNQAYYQKFPEDVQNVRQIARHIQGKGGAIALPAGGTLTVPRLLTLGIGFGFHGGLDAVHGLILRAKLDLDQLGFLDRPILSALERDNPLDTNIIYAILHEPIYNFKPGVRSGWAAHTAGKSLAQYSWLTDPEAFSAVSDEPLFFTGEMIFPFHFDTYPELIQLKAAAEELAAYDDWPALYDEVQLRKNDVPVYAASYTHDMYVDADFARETAALVRGCKVYETNVMYHNALRARTNDVLGELFKLRDGEID
ncbi:proline iminopeptidase [Plectosphaerella plurivora]|uniref:Proline iminopeptidase n=1 Tax=Plectosphaerella plurivora TaxID=936078 RepID=A0A9P8VFN1_9PEZI|nr:proline iminopeptidase [Plectosphaerella plurivora]